MFTLTGADGERYESAMPGQFGGHRRGKLYGRLDCPAALRAIARGGYVKHRVFFADQQTAVAAGYRPCAVCLPEQYAAWTSDEISHSGGRLRLPGKSPNRRSENP
jgi:methylphosphotriester-DNA--protein-cysteine methyltransferase